MGKAQVRGQGQCPFYSRLAELYPGSDELLASGKQSLPLDSANGAHCAASWPVLSMLYEGRTVRAACPHTQHSGLPTPYMLHHLGKHTGQALHQLEQQNWSYIIFGQMPEIGGRLPAAKLMRTYELVLQTFMNNKHLQIAWPLSTHPFMPCTMRPQKTVDGEIRILDTPQLKALEQKATEKLEQACRDAGESMGA